MADITWVGGISEMKKVATLAETYHLPIAPHDRSGPVNLLASAHLVANLPNAMIMKTTRVFYNTYYSQLVDEPPQIKNGMLLAPQRPGLGAALLPEVRRRGDA